YVTSPALDAGGFGRVAADNLSLRSAPDPNATRLGGLSAGTIVALTGGPVSAGGYTWYEVTSPVTEWPSVRQTDQGSWIATDGGRSTFVTPIRAPNSTLVTAG